LALLIIPEWASWVTMVSLASPFDDTGQSGFYEWLLVLAQGNLAPGHIAAPIVFHGVAFAGLCQMHGAALDNNGRLQGW
ncbi:hypothetical protein EK21DRAFT_57694, partial [Setomelanomma holmii]